MIFGGRCAVGVDIGESAVKVLEVERDGRSVKVLRTAVRSLPPGLGHADPDGLGKFLKELLADAGIRSDRVYFGLPRHQAVLRTMQVPEGDEAETQQMIRFQARKVLPMGGEKLAIGYVLRDMEGRRTAVVIGAKSQVYQGLLKAAAIAGLKVQGVTLSSFGTANSYLKAYPEGAPGVVVDVGGRMTEITLSAWGRFAASREASLGSETLIRMLGQESGMSRAASSQAVRGAKLGPDAPPGTMKWATDLSLEIDRTLRAFAAEGFPAPERILLTGGGSQVGDLAPFLGERLGVPVQPFPPEIGLSSWPSSTAGSPGALFVPALGYLLGGFVGVGTVFDFGTDFFDKADAKPSRRGVYLGIAAAVAALLAMYLVPDYYLNEWEISVVAQEKKLTDTEDRFKKEFEVLGNKLKDLRTWTERRANWIDILREMTKAVPESKEVFLTQVQFREGSETQKVLGRAEDEGAVNRFVNALTASPLILEVERRTLKQNRDRKERHKWDFELNAYLTAPEEEVGP